MDREDSGTCTCH